MITLTPGWGQMELLFLGWLAKLGWADEGLLEQPDNAVKPAPPAPAGLGDLPDTLAALVEFLCLDLQLLAAAMERSAPLRPIDETDLAAWLADQPEEDKDQWLVQVWAGEHAMVQGDLARGVRVALQEANAEPEPYTVAQLRSRADALRAAAEQKEARAAAAASHRLRVAAAERKEARLRRVALRGEAVWPQIEALIMEKSAIAYDQAVTMLCDLKELADRDGAEQRFSSRVETIAELHRRKVTLVRRLKAAGLV